MSCWYCLGILLVQLLYWVVSCPFGTALVNLLVGFLLPLGVAGVLSGRSVFGSVKRVRLHRKTPAHLTAYGRDEGFQSRPRVWKKLRVEGSGSCFGVAKVPRLLPGVEAHGPLDKVGVG